MRITQITRIKEVAQFLINEFDLRIHGIGKRLPSGTELVIKRSAVKKKHSPENVEFEISNSTTVREFQEYFFSVSGLNVELRNSNSIKVSENIRLESGRDLELPRLSDSRNFDSSIHAALSIATGPSNYSDVDWVYKILQTAARQASDDNEKIKLIETLCQIAEANMHFSEKHVKYILNQICKSDSDYMETAKIFSQSNNQSIKLLAGEIIKEYGHEETFNPSVN